LIQGCHQLDEVQVQQEERKQPQVEEEREVEEPVRKFQQEVEARAQKFEEAAEELSGEVVERDLRRNR
jgi:hypothetical protein